MSIYHQQGLLQYYPKKILAETKKGAEHFLKSVFLDFCKENDYILYSQKGLAYMRQARLLRITTQAYLQKTLLSYPDLVLLLTSSISTLKRDVKEIQAQGILVPLGRILEVEKFLYPARALDLYFQGVYLPSVLEKTFMTQGEFEKVLEDFRSACQSREFEGLGRGKSSARQLSPFAHRGEASPLMDHFYRVYRRHQRHEFLMGFKKETSRRRKSEKSLVY